MFTCSATARTAHARSFWCRRASWLSSLSAWRDRCAKGTLRARGWRDAPPPPSTVALYSHKGVRPHTLVAADARNRVLVARWRPSSLRCRNHFLNSHLHRASPRTLMPWEGAPSPPCPLSLSHHVFFRITRLSTGIHVALLSRASMGSMAASEVPKTGPSTRTEPRHASPLPSARRAAMQRVNEWLDGSSSSGAGCAAAVFVRRG